MQEHSLHNEIFSPAVQSAVWSSMEPGTRAFFAAYEEREDWTHNQEDSPNIFEQIGGDLPKVVSIPLDSDCEDIAHQLIRILTSIPFRQFVIALMWLEHMADEEAEEYGWGIACYVVASEYEEGQEWYAQAANFVQRVDIMAKSNIAAKLFTNARLLSS